MKHTLITGIVAAAAGAMLALPAQADVLKDKYAGKTVAVRNFDRIDLGVVQRLADRFDVIETVLMADGVHAVAQCDVLDVDLLFFVDCHDQILQAVAMRRSMTRSAVRNAADVMMSRLPAYFGR